MFKNFIRKTAAAATLSGAAFIATPAQAADFSFSLNIGHPRPVIVQERAPILVAQPIVASRRRWVPERFETRTEQVLVCPERIERRWIPNTTEVRHDRQGRAYTVTIAGHYEEVRMPAQYETRTYTVAIPGYWEEQPACVASAPIVFAPGRHDDRWDRQDGNRWSRDHDRRDNDRHDNDRGPIVYRSGYTTR